MTRILVVDDEKGIREFLAEALERDGHVVEQAPDGDEAARLIGNKGYDLVITDLRMPGRDGIALLRLLREEQPDAECIVLTAHGSVESAVDAMKLGAFDYLEKPLGSPAQLRLLVSRALERRGLLAFKEARGLPGSMELSWGAPAMLPVLDALRKVAPTPATVLLLGESGTGKEVAARALHAWSARDKGAFVAVNCAALTDTLLESELFGHEKGAFTGAHGQRRGRLELAQGGTFFLDEIGELRLDLQAKLLRVLQERKFERVGGTRTLEADVRWIAATNRDLKAMVADGRFRRDLYYRLAVFPIELPALRQRQEDIAPLARSLLQAMAREIGRPTLRLSDEAARMLETARFPGNVRELRNALERAAILSGGTVIEPEHLPPDLLDDVETPPTEGTLEAREIATIRETLHEVGGNRRKAAERLGIGLRTLYEKLKRNGIT